MLAIHYYRNGFFWVYKDQEYGPLMIYGVADIVKRFVWMIYGVADIVKWFVWTTVYMSHIVHQKISHKRLLHGYIIIMINCVADMHNL